MDLEAIDHFCLYLRRRNYSPHTVDNYGRDLHGFFTTLAKAPHEVSWRDIEVFIAQQQQAQRAATTIHRRLHALKHFFDYLMMEGQGKAMNPVKPSHFPRRGRPLPKQLTQDHVRALFAQITHPLDHALALLMLRGGLRVSEVAHLRLQDIDWDQPALRIEQGKGRKDRIARRMWSPPSGPAWPRGRTPCLQAWCSGIRSARSGRCPPKASRKSWSGMPRRPA